MESAFWLAHTKQATNTIVFHATISQNKILLRKLMRKIYPNVLNVGVSVITGIFAVEKHSTKYLCFLPSEATI